MPFDLIVRNIMNTGGRARVEPPWPVAECRSVFPQFLSSLDRDALFRASGEAGGEVCRAVASERPFFVPAEGGREIPDERGRLSSCSIFVFDLHVRSSCSIFVFELRVRSPAGLARPTSRPHRSQADEGERVHHHHLRPHHHLLTQTSLVSIAERKVCPGEVQHLEGLRGRLL